MFHLSGKDDRLEEWRLIISPGDDSEGSGNQAALNSTKTIFPEQNEKSPFFKMSESIYNESDV